MLFGKYKVGSESHSRLNNLRLGARPFAAEDASYCLEEWAAEPLDFHFLTYISKSHLIYLRSLCDETRLSLFIMPPHFPAEVWRIVFAHVDISDEQVLIHLWRDCRRVSRGFREEVESIFAAEVVPGTCLWVSSG